jgi:hypothetical protein
MECGEGFGERGDPAGSKLSSRWRMPSRSLRLLTREAPHVFARQNPSDKSQGKLEEKWRQPAAR